jgi:pilus assembly protein TadC
MNVLLIQFLSFASVVLFVLGANSLIRGNRSVTAKSSRPGLFGWFPEEIETIGDLLGSRIDALFPEEAKTVQNQLFAAALDDQLKVRDVRGLQGLLGISLFITALLFVLVVTLEGAWAVAAGLVFGLLGYMWPLMWLRRAAQERQEKISKELPYAIDLLTVAMEAGQDFGAAVRHFVNEVGTGPLRQEFAIMLHETDLNKSRVEAMRSMAARMQVEEFKSIVTAVVQSTEMGASVAAALKVQAEEIRRARFHRAERKAARAPSLMLIPVALFIVPAVFIVILTPVAMRMIDTMHRVK